MKSNDFWRLASGLVIAAIFLAPFNFQAQAEPASAQYREWEKLIKELNLTPEKAAEFQARGAKFAQIREGLIENLGQNESDLEKAIAATQPDEAKIEKLVPLIISEHNQLFESFKEQRQEEMAILTPLQRGKYLLALKKWHAENCELVKTAK